MVDGSHVRMCICSVVLKNIRSRTPKMNVLRMLLCCRTDFINSRRIKMHGVTQDISFILSEVKDSKLGLELGCIAAETLTRNEN